ncbi:hypothetical protein ACFVJM_38830 [Streptomyces virginiae]|uniref:hypothetical protein n=1 Tax=Streptomyces virginiae TaxID=1961 RepID=UPI0036310DA6
MDRATAMADARTALCLAAGVDIEDIDPASGYDISRRAYRRSRQSWIDHMGQEGLSYFYVRPDLEKVVARWTERRPQYTAGDDWAAAGVDAHIRYWRERGGHCRHKDCLLHDPGSLQFEARYRNEDGTERVAVWATDEAYAVLYGSDGEEADQAAMPVGADELCALSTITDRWGEDLTDWRRISRREAVDPTPGDAPSADRAAVEPVTLPEVADRLF